MIDPAVLESRNARARAWFDALRDRIVAAFEQLEVDAPADLFPGEPAKFELKPWVREAGGGGVMGFLRGGRFILHEGNNCAPETPARHFAAMYEAGKQFAVYPPHAPDQGYA
jgi:coproporphyrinogen III oxidase